MIDFKGTKGMLFIQPNETNTEEVYITTSPEDFAPAIGSVFQNKYSVPETTKEVRDANALAWAAMPELIQVLEAADRFLNTQLKSEIETNEWVKRLAEKTNLAKLKAGLI